jgi:hypothetical protein
MKKSGSVLHSAVVALLFFSIACGAQEKAGEPARIGVGVNVSSLGFGAEMAARVTSRSNLRAGFNLFNYSRQFSKDGVSYAGELNFRSVQVNYDWFPFRGAFHLSPGMLIYNGNQIKANASVPGGQTFTLNNTTYASDAANPVSGTGKVDFMKAAPTFLVGWGNLIPHSGRHFSVPVEFGVAFTGAPRAALNLNGSACDSTGVNCRAIGSDPTIQSNIASEQNKINHDMAPFKVYPVISAGLAFSF